MVLCMMVLGGGGGAGGSYRGHMRGRTETLY